MFLEVKFRNNERFFFFLIQVATTILGLDDRTKEMLYIPSMGIYVVNKDVMLQKCRRANDLLK